ncbi:hypothetical protein C4565_08305 [Candidatus Parcubacteria bacterium]|nr:MAG: hypothetical protein C4565_08305 [Candidatus Parcubacteria bacterium]
MRTFDINDPKMLDLLVATDAVFEETYLGGLPFKDTEAGYRALDAVNAKIDEMVNAAGITSEEWTQWLCARVAAKEGK